MDKEKIITELEEKKRRDGIMKKKIVTAAVATAVISAFLFGVMILINIGWFTEEKQPEPEWYEFAPITDFYYDIMEDDWYKNQLSIGPIVRLHNAQTGVGIELYPEEYGEHGEAVKLLTDLITAVQMGDNDAYNDCFSDSYFIAEGKKKAEADGVTYTDAEYLAFGKKSEFTMQQVYDAVITMYSEEENEKDLLHCTYELKYKIHLNNGTLRNDMGSDCYRVQQVVMLENEDTGELEIITVNTFTDRTVEYSVVLWKAILAIVVTAAFVTAVIIASVRYIKKSKKNENAEEKAKKEETDE